MTWAPPSGWFDVARSPPWGPGDGEAEACGWLAGAPGGVCSVEEVEDSLSAAVGDAGSLVRTVTVVASAVCVTGARAGWDGEEVGLVVGVGPAGEDSDRRVRDLLNRECAVDQREVGECMAEPVPGEYSLPSWRGGGRGLRL